MAGEDSAQGEQTSMDVTTTTTEGKVRWEDQQYIDLAKEPRLDLADFRNVFSLLAPFFYIHSYLSDLFGSFPKRFIILFPENKSCNECQKVELDEERNCLRDQPNARDHCER